MKVAELLALVDAGDDEGVLAALSALPWSARPGAKEVVRQRKALATWETVGGKFTSRGTDAQLRASWLAVFGTGSARDATGWEGSPGPQGIVRAAQLLQPPWLDDWAAAVELRWWDAVRALVRAGLLPEPTRRTYVLGLIPVRWTREQRGADAVLMRLRADPDLLRGLVWRLFEVEGEGEHSLSSHDGSYWVEALAALAGTGEIDRGRLLDASLRALTLGFATGRQPVYVELHESLAPTVEERAARQEAYRDVMRVGAPASAKRAMDALREVHRAGLLDVAETIGALGPVVSVPVAGTAKAALMWLRELPGDPEAVADVAALGLLHAKADVQAAALKVLGGLGPSVAGPRVAGALEGLAATNRAAAEALAGTKAAPPPVSRVARAEEDREVAPIGSVEALALGWMRILEAPGEVDLAEQVLDASVRLAGQRAVGFEAVRARLAAGLRGVGLEAMLGCVATALVEGVVPDWVATWGRRGDGVWTSATLLQDRLRELFARIRAPDGLPVLSTPTHRGGWISPEVLLERLARWRGRDVPVADALVALLRVAPGPVGPVGDAEIERAVAWALGADVPAGGAVPAWWAAAARRRGEPEAAERLFPELRGLDWHATPPLALGYGRRHEQSPEGPLLGAPSPRCAEARPSPVPLAWVFSAAGRPRLLHEGSDGLRFDYRDRSEWLGGECAPWLAALAPSLTDELHREAYHRVFLGIIWSDVDHTQPEVLAPLLDPRHRWTEPSWSLLAACLCSLLPAVHTRAADVCVSLVDRGAFAPALLADGLAGLLGIGAAPGRRLARALEIVASSGPAHAEAVYAVILGAVRPADHLPRDLSALLELAVELKAAGARAEVPDALRAVAAGLGRGSRAGVAARGILGAG